MFSDFDGKVTTLFHNHQTFPPISFSFHSSYHLTSPTHHISAVSLLYIRFFLQFLLHSHYLSDVQLLLYPALHLLLDVRLQDVVQGTGEGMAVIGLTLRRVTEEDGAGIQPGSHAVVLRLKMGEDPVEEVYHLLQRHLLALGEMTGKRATQVIGWLEVALQVNPLLHPRWYITQQAGIAVTVLRRGDKLFHYLVETLLGRFLLSAQKESKCKSFAAFLKKFFIVLLFFIVNEYQKLPHCGKLEKSIPTFVVPSHRLPESVNPCR